MNSVTITGVNTVVKNFAIQEGIAIEKIRLLVEQAANTVRDAAKGVVPVDTGNLMNSIQVQSFETTSTGATATIAPNTDYAVYVEYGTSRMRAQPYMRPAKLEGEAFIASRLGALKP